MPQPLLPVKRRKERVTGARKGDESYQLTPSLSCALLFEFLPPKAPKLFPRFAEVKAGGVDGRVATDSANYETSQTLVLVCLEFGNAVNH